MLQIEDRHIKRSHQKINNEFLNSLCAAGCGAEGGREVVLDCKIKKIVNCN